MSPPLLDSDFLATSAGEFQCGGNPKHGQNLLLANRASFILIVLLILIGQIPEWRLTG